MLPNEKKTLNFSGPKIQKNKIFNAKLWNNVHELRAVWQAGLVLVGPSAFCSDSSLESNNSISSSTKMPLWSGFWKYLTAFVIFFWKTAWSDSNTWNFDVSLLKSGTSPHSRSVFSRTRDGNSDLRKLFSLLELMLSRARKDSLVLAESTFARLDAFSTSTSAPSSASDEEIVRVRFERSKFIFAAGKDFFRFF